MQTIPSARLEQRMIAGIAAAMLASVLCSVGVIRQSAQPTAESPSSRPFWSTDANTSNLAVVELQRSGAGWGKGRP